MGKHQKENAEDLFSYSKRKRRKKFDFIEFLLKPAVMISITAVLVIAMLVSTFALSFAYNHNKLFGKYDDDDLGITANLPDDVLNIALFGIDTRSPTSFSGNSDSIMIISIDSTRKLIKLTSIMRDTLIPIPGYSASKINSAYAKGGPKLAVKTINENFGLNIRDYCTVNFTGMKNIIDAVGGITATLTDAEVKDANKHLKYQAMVEGIEPDYIKQSGTQLLSGIQAVSYARIRYATNPNGNANDYGRTDRQRYVMEQLFNKALTIKKSQYPELIKAMLPYIETSMNYDEILNLAAFLTSEVHFLQARIPMQEYVINDNFKIKSGASTVYYNIDYAADVLHGFLYDDIDPDAFIKINPINKKGWYQTNVSSNPSVTTSAPQTSSDPDTSGDTDASSDTDVSSDINTSGDVIDESSDTDVSSDIVSDVSSDTSSQDASSNPTDPDDPNTSNGTEDPNDPDDTDDPDDTNQNDPAQNVTTSTPDARRR